jgi:hypothetical protein
MTGTEYRVRLPFRGVDIAQGNAIVNIPNGAVVSIVNKPAAKTFVTVRWGTQELLVFERDLCERAIEEPFTGPFFGCS